MTRIDAMTRDHGMKSFMKLLPIALAAALLATGCSLAPTYERPAAPVPTVFPSDPVQPAGPAAASIAWQNYFTDPRLARLIDTALANNRDLRIAVQNIEVARAQFQIERSALFPAPRSQRPAVHAPARTLPAAVAWAPA